jgi:uncharacterized protein (TIGR03083 family)
VNDDNSLQPLVAAEYLTLAYLLGPASEADWNTPSLCDGWRVREVVAHVTMPARYDQESFMAELRTHEFDFGRLSNAVAARDAQLPTDALVADLCADTLLTWTPPEGGYHAALNHAVIHRLDVTVPLGRGRRPPDETMRVVLTDLAGGGGHRHFGTRISGRTLQATDLDWSYGSGPALQGPAAELALVLCGRRLPPGRLQGGPL